FVLSLGTLAVFAVASLTMVWAREFILPAYLNVMLFVLALVLNAFVYGATDFDSKASMFPAHMLVLPATTRQLVAWPMLFCATFLAVMWLLSGGLLLRPAGMHPPLVWPATAVAAGAVWIQAISWTPFPTPLARVPVIVLAMVPLVLLGILAGLHEHDSAVLV